MSPRTTNYLKRLGCAIAAVAVLMMQSNPSLAKFGGTLRSDIPWTVDMTPGVVGLDGTAVTVTLVDAKGRQDTDCFTIPQGESTFAPYAGTRIPRGTRRIIIELDFPQSTFVQVRIIQSTTIITVDSGDGAAARFVFDVA